MKMHGIASETACICNAELYFLHAAVSYVSGVTVLVTHLERKPLDPVYRGLLLKQFYVDKDGQRVVKIGHREFKYHPQFALYLSTSVPLFLKGKNIRYEREKERSKNQTNKKSVVRVEKFKYPPQFALYLSTSFLLFLKGKKVKEII